MLRNYQIDFRRMEIRARKEIQKFAQQSHNGKRIWYHRIIELINF